MKKCSFILLLSIVLVQAFAATGTGSNKNTASSTVNEYASRSIQMPHTELEGFVSNAGIIASHTAVTDHTGVADVVTCRRDVHNITAVNTVANSCSYYCKEYLWHIYPSHHFW